MEPGLVSAVGSVSGLAFGSSQVRFMGPTYSFTSCQLLEERVSTEYWLTAKVSRAQQKLWLG